MKTVKKKHARTIESHLKNYKAYKVAMKNLQQSLDEILPNITTNYTWREGYSGIFKIVSTTENAVLDRVAGSKAVYLREQLNIYQTIVKSIDGAMEVLDDDEVKFVKCRYFEGWSVEKTAQYLGYSSQNCFKIRNQVMDKLLISLKNLNSLAVDF
ncbi:hypothetical protein V6C27_10570 [Peptococcaceae bacterium 1198_IL3148]